MTFSLLHPFGAAVDDRVLFHGEEEEERDQGGDGGRAGVQLERFRQEVQKGDPEQDAAAEREEPPERFF